MRSARSAPRAEPTCGPGRGTAVEDGGGPRPDANVSIRVAVARPARAGCRRPDVHAAPVPSVVTPLPVSVWIIDLDQPLAGSDRAAGASRRGRSARGRRPPRRHYSQPIRRLARRAAHDPRSPAGRRARRRCHLPELRVLRRPGPREARGRRGPRLGSALSHSSDVAVIALADGVRIGVDIEVERQAACASTPSRTRAEPRRPRGLARGRCHAAAPRVSRTLDREGGVPEGDRRRHHGVR